MVASNVLSPTSALLLLLSLCSFLYILSPVSSWLKHRRNGRKLPPGPLRLPIIGNLHMLGKLPHQTLYHLAKRYGPIMSLRLGNVTTIVVSSPEAAELFLKTHDNIFAGRPKSQAIEYMAYESKGMIWSQHGSYWRNFKKLFSTELLSPSKLQSFTPIRRAGLRSFVESLRKTAASGEVVDLSAEVPTLIGNIMYEMIWGRIKLDGYSNLKENVQELMILIGVPNFSDYLPWLSALDLQGFKRRFKAVRKVLDEVLDKIIDEHEQNLNEGQEQRKDMVDLMLSMLNQPINPQHDDGEAVLIDRTNIKAIILDLISAAFDTSSTTIEWALSELLRHPQVMLHLQKELETEVGMNRMVEETDLVKLTYLDAVVKEIFRLHPTAPLLVPHESVEDITVNGYFIPKKSRIIVNLWAIGRDPMAWPDSVEEFRPERFIGSNIDVRGHDFQLLPFGSGRRGCPGMHLGLTTVKTILAQLVHCFDWELPNGMLVNELDMEEEFGITVRRAHHLLAKPRYRLVE